MSALIPDVGKVAFMQILMPQISTNPDCTIHLFKNNYFPTDATVLTDLVDATFSGYGPVVMPVAVDKGIQLGGDDSWLYFQATFAATGLAGLPTAIYGYFIVWINPIGHVHNLLWVERFAMPLALVASGQKIQFALSLGLKQGIL